MLVLAAGLLTLAVGLWVVPAVRELARWLGMVAAPRKDRWHSRPTALLGGVGIFAAFAVGLAAFPDAMDEAWPVLLSATLVFVVGLVDDVVQMRPLLKLGFQVVAAALVVLAGVSLPWTHNAFVDGAITMLWLVGITNAINLLDNMDGLAAGIAAIACVFLGVTFALNGQRELALLPALLAGACLGFLRYNFKPASIFMGDCGSMFLGSMLGGMALLSSYGRSRSLASVLLTPVLIMMIPILDTTLVTVTRRLRGQPVSQGGRDHTSHRLVALGASERRAVVILWVLAAVSGALALAVRSLGADALLAVVPTFALLMLSFALFLHWVSTFQVAAAVTSFDSGMWSWKLAGILLLDCAVLGLVYLGAYGIRWDWQVPPDQRSVLLYSMFPLVVLELGVLYIGGLYRDSWRTPRVEDLVTIGRSCLAASLASALLVELMYGFSGPSRGVLVLNGLLLMIGITWSRLSFYLFPTLIKGTGDDRSTRRVLVYGTGERSLFLAQELLRDPAYRRHPVGFLGEIANSRGDVVGNLPVFDETQLRGVVETQSVGEILISGRDVSGRLVSAAAQLGISLRTVRLSLE